MKPYTLKELNELKEWFDTHELPQEIQVEKSIHIPNLKPTLDSLFTQAFICYENPKIQGCIILLEKIKSVLEKR